MLGSNYTEVTRDNWATVPGRDVEFTNNASGKPTKITYLEGDTVVFAQYLTYDANGNVIKIECKAS